MDTEQFINLAFSNIRNALRDIPVVVVEEDGKILVKNEKQQFCTIKYEENCFEIHDFSDEWRIQTTFQCQQSHGGSWYYVTETLDECVGEVKRLVKFVTAQQKSFFSGSLPVINWTSDKATSTLACKKAFTELLAGTECRVEINGDPGDDNNSKKEISLNMYGPEGKLLRLWPKPDDHRFDVIIQKRAIKTGRISESFKLEYNRISYKEIAEIVLNIARKQ